MDALRFHVDDQPVQVSDLAPTTTLLQWLRASGRTGTKEGCAEGDCGACTVLLLDEDGSHLRAVNACLVLLPMVHGRRLWTVQGLARGGQPHPAQAALVATSGSQCGYCTPGFVMALTEAAHRPELKQAPAQDWRLDDQVCGNLCRCTGYRPIRDALRQVAGSCPDDVVAPHLRAAPGGDARASLHYQAGDERYLAPVTVEGALAALEQHPDARVVCGATDLGLAVTQQHRRFPTLVSLERIPALRRLDVVAGTVHVGAALPLCDLEAWSEQGLPVLHRMLRYFGSRQIKHRATVGGNLCNASPIGDLPPVLLALDAVAVVAGPGGQRRVPVRDFFLGYRRTALAPGELLVAVELPLPSPDTLLGAYKVSRRRELDISAVAAAFAVQLQDGAVAWARLAFGGMAATPARAAQAEAALHGQPWGPDAVAAAQEALQADFQPIDDHRGSAWYRRTLARNLLLGFFEETRQQPQVPLQPRHTGTLMLPGGDR
ncbi:xanthine dehydrogenase small subunit [Myxococcota bacterium]|nr:xanthine dehydrogenase small subunit [Myxococcota bacterium]